MVSDIGLNSCCWQLEPCCLPLHLCQAPVSFWSQTPEIGGTLMRVVTLIWSLCGHKIPAIAEVCTYLEKENIVLLCVRVMGGTCLMSSCYVFCSCHGICGFLDIRSVQNLLQQCWWALSLWSLPYNGMLWVIFQPFPRQAWHPQLDDRVGKCYLLVVGQFESNSGFFWRAIL